MHVLIPISVSGKTHAILGPLSDTTANPDSLREFFLTYHRYKPLSNRNKPKASDEIETAENPHLDNQSTPLIEKPIDLDYMNNEFRVFRSCPLFKDPSDYLGWLKKIENKKAQVWKNMGIFDMIQLSNVGPVCCQSMLVYSLYFWDNIHNNFHFPCGMMTPTLFDIAFITGLKPTGETYDPNLMAENTIFFDTTKAAFTIYIAYYHDKNFFKVYDQEHIAFLALWLSCCVFCLKSLQVAKKFLTMANQLHDGHNLCLSEMILASLYESLEEGVTTLNNI